MFLEPDMRNRSIYGDEKVTGVSMEGSRVGQPRETSSCVRSRDNEPTFRTALAGYRAGAHALLLNR